LLLGLLLAPSFYGTAQTISIPDPLFEQILIDQEIDSDGIINGEILTADALAVSTLIIAPEPGSVEYIEDLTGIEGFINLESLTVNFTNIGELNVSTLVNLKYLDCVDNGLTSLDVSSNPLLEYLDITSAGDVGYLNNISEIDLSNNPNIKTLTAYGGIDRINLKNGNNNPDMSININAFYIEGPEPEKHTCIEVDDAVAAQNNQSPYSEWTILHNYTTYTFTENCALSTYTVNKNTVSVYPNPTADVLYFETADDTTINKVTIFDIRGIVVKEYNNITDFISVSNLQTGIYIIKLVSGNTTFTQKIIQR